MGSDPKPAPINDAALDELERIATGPMFAVVWPEGTAAHMIPALIARIRKAEAPDA